MKNFTTLLIILLLSYGVQAQATFTLDSTVVTQTVVADSLDIPWEIIWGPDSHIWCTERFGQVSRIDPATGQKNIILNIASDVYSQSEAGMLGMVLHPDFANTPDVFIAYTYLNGSSIKERLVRFSYSGTALVPIDTLIENITGNTTHIGCRLIIHPDNTLFMTTGDAQNQSLPQNTSSVVGKILRMNLDGSIPADNPIPGSFVWSYGHRNAQGLWVAPNGIMYSSEHGPTTDDELNIVERNKNYGWPNVNGFCDTPPEIAFCNANNVVEPLTAWTPTIAPSDIIWYDHPAIPEFQDKLLMTVLKDKSLIVFGFNSNGDSIVSQEKFFENQFGRLRDVCFSPTGDIYLATNGNSWSNTNPFTHSIIKLSNLSYVPNSTEDVLQEEKNLLVNPNPIRSGQNLMLQMHGTVTGTFMVYDIFGKKILQKELKGTEQLLTNSMQGLYLWKFATSRGVIQMGKILVN